MAATGGIFVASRLIFVNQSSGSGDILLNAIAAVVIGGTSLFGGKAWSALLGMLVIGAISNKMDLLGLSSASKFMIIGGVLALTVIADSTTRRGRTMAGAGSRSPAHRHAEGPLTVDHSIHHRPEHP
jgi:D-xylose transport system permease protein